MAASGSRSEDVLPRRGKFCQGANSTQVLALAGALANLVLCLLSVGRLGRARPQPGHRAERMLGPGRMETSQDVATRRAGEPSPWALPPA